VLRAAGMPLSPGQVRERLAGRGQGELSYSTVVTIVSRLHAKGCWPGSGPGAGSSTSRWTRPVWPPAR